MSEKLLTPIEIGLTAAIVALEGNEPLILTASGSDGDRLAGLPFGPFDAVSHRTFEIGLRAWVEEQAGLRLGYVEQLYTFGDRGRHTEPGDTGAHVVSIGYLALTRAADNAARAPGATFEPWYRFFPWEDWRKEKPRIVAETIAVDGISRCLWCRAMCYIAQRLDVSEDRMVLSHSECLLKSDAFFSGGDAGNRGTRRNLGL